MVDRSSRPFTCPHWAGPLSNDMETSSWTIAPVKRDSFSMALKLVLPLVGRQAPSMDFNHAMPIVRKYVKGPMWVHFFIGAPPVIVFSSSCAGLAGGAVPALAQLVSLFYHVAVSSSPLARSGAQDDGMHKTRSSSPLG